MPGANSRYSTNTCWIIPTLHGRRGTWAAYGSVPALPQMHAWPKSKPNGASASLGRIPPASFFCKKDHESSRPPEAPGRDRRASEFRPCAKQELKQREARPLGVPTSGRVPPQAEGPASGSTTHPGSVALHHLKPLELHPVLQYHITSARCGRVAFYSFQKGIVIKNLLHARHCARPWNLKE